MKDKSTWANYMKSSKDNQCDISMSHPHTYIQLTLQLVCLFVDAQLTRHLEHSRRVKKRL